MRRVQKAKSRVEKGKGGNAEKGKRKATGNRLSPRHQNQSSTNHHSNANSDTEGTSPDILAPDHSSLTRTTLSLSQSRQMIMTPSGPLTKIQNIQKIPHLPYLSNVEEAGLLRHKRLLSLSFNA